jgi:hypothetical protein
LEAEEGRKTGFGAVFGQAARSENPRAGGGPHGMPEKKGDWGMLIPVNVDGKR